MIPIFNNCAYTYTQPLFDFQKIENIDPPPPPSPPPNFLSTPFENLLEELIKLGICDEFGKVSDSFSHYSLPEFHRKEENQLFKEFFKNLSLPYEKGTLHVNLGLVIGTFCKWMITHDKSAFSPRFSGPYLRYVLLKFLPDYATKVFSSLGVKDFQKEKFDSSLFLPKHPTIETKLFEKKQYGIREEQKLLNAVCQSFNKHLSSSETMRSESESIRPEVCETPITGKIINSKEEGSLHLKGLIQQTPAWNWLIRYRGFASNFSVKDFHLPLNQILGCQTFANRDRASQPKSLQCGDLQGFLDLFFGFIRGDGEWFEFMSLMTNGDTSMQRPLEERFLCREYELFDKLYGDVNRDFYQLNDAIQCFLNDNYPDQIEFHLVFLLNTWVYLTGKNMEREGRALFTAHFLDLSQSDEINPIAKELIALLTPEDCPISLLSAFLQVTGFLHAISSKASPVQLKSEERVETVILIWIGEYALQIPYQIDEAFQVLQDYASNFPQDWSRIETRFTQLLLHLLPPITQEASDEVIMRMGLTISTLNKRSEEFLNSSSHLLSAIGLMLCLRGNRPIELQKVGEILDGFAKYRDLEEGRPLHALIVQAIRNCVSNLKTDFDYKTKMVGKIDIENNKYFFEKNDLDLETEKVNKTKKMIQDLTALVSYFINDLNDLEFSFWYSFFSKISTFDALVGENFTLELYPLWKKRVNVFLSSDVSHYMQVLNDHLLSLKRAATEGNLEAKKAILSLALIEKDENRLSDIKTSIDCRLSIHVIFLTELFSLKKGHFVFTLNLLISLLKLLKEAQTAVSENQGVEVGCLMTQMDYQNYQFSISISFLAYLEKRKINIIDIVNKVGVENFYLDYEYNRKLIWLFCENEHLNDLNHLLINPDLMFKWFENFKQNEPVINYSTVISFLMNNASSERILGTVQLWFEMADFESRKQTYIPKERAACIEWGLKIIEKAMEFHKDGKYVISRALIRLLKIPDLVKINKKGSLKALSYSLIQFLSSQTITESHGRFLVIVIQYIFINNLKKECHETILSCQDAILYALKFDEKQFEELIEQYKLLEGDNFFFEYNNTSFIGNNIALTGRDTDSCERKVTFVKKLIEKISSIEGYGKLLLLRNACFFFMEIKKEYEMVSIVKGKKQLEIVENMISEGCQSCLEALFKELSVVKEFDIISEQMTKYWKILDHMFDRKKECIEKLIDQMSSVIPEVKISFWKMAGSLLILLKKEIEKEPLLKAEKEKELKFLDIKLKEAFKLLTK